MSLPPPENDSERLDRMLYHLEQMDRRDRLRTWGGFLKGIIALIPVLLVVWSAWYFVQHGDEIMKKIASTAAEQAAKASQEQAENLMIQMGIKKK